MSNESVTPALPRFNDSDIQDAMRRFRPIQKRDAPADALCECGCGQPLVNRRSHTRFYDSTCRKRANRADANAKRDADRIKSTVRRWRREGRTDLLAELLQDLGNG